MPTYYSVDRGRSFSQHMELNFLISSSDSGQLTAPIAEQFGAGLSPHGINYLIYNNLNNYVQNNGNQPNVIIEYALELLRQQRYPEKPSRFVSMFGCETLDEAKHFRGQYFPNRQSTPIYEIISNDRVHKGDMQLLDAGCPIHEFDTRLNAYWSGESYALYENYEPFWEIIIPLPARTGEQVA
ncbi:DUF2441 domain-containing protein [Morganella morganii]|uniref:DUF2441 domain-containing protein n=1 Tax=Morganella morganii TaxID=582 RepID=UPI0021CE12B9|nr:DUF2441 domain-containing protein [Morganella morganii]MCU6226573.1 DUF2441 domain-containing protein [Morganella morganii]MCU6234839.1 DUF2441 domain-containing protein [Morganella morganii]